LYVVIVPLCGLLRGHRTSAAAGVGASLAALGLYLLSINERFTVMAGDWYQLAGAFVISAQVMLVGRYARRHDPLVLALVQFVACGLACCAVALAIEPIRLADIVRAAPTIVYGGALSVGIGYTIQVVAQRDAAPAHAAVIFSMEGMFAAFAGWLVLGETLTPRALTGCALMLAGLIACQWLPARMQTRMQTQEPQTEIAAAD
jgi:drug/metabolite transporter (DMT)-like permease